MARAKNKRIYSKNKLTKLKYALTVIEKNIIFKNLIPINSFNNLKIFINYYI